MIKSGHFEKNELEFYLNPDMSWILSVKCRDNHPFICKRWIWNKKIQLKTRLRAKCKLLIETPGY